MTYRQHQNYSRDKSFGAKYEDKLLEVLNTTDYKDDNISKFKYEFSWYDFRNKKT